MLNGRITNKTFKRWIKFPYFSKKLFKNFNLSLASNQETFNYLKKLSFKNVKYIGNLKYSQSEFENSQFNKYLKKAFRNRVTWCASSTHNPEEDLIAKTHKNLKKKNKRLLTIIIPRHVERCVEIKNNLEKLDLKIQMDVPKKRINLDTDIYLVNSYGKTKLFYKNCKNVFLGGSLIKHGGQNPLEAARYGCSIISGPYVQNFKEIYEFLKKNKISRIIRGKDELAYELNYLLKKRNDSKKLQYKIKKIGDKILKQTYNIIFIKKINEV